jgi:aspartate 1-decarboxylase
MKQILDSIVNIEDNTIVISFYDFETNEVIIEVYKPKWIYLNEKENKEV